MHAATAVLAPVFALVGVTAAVWLVMLVARGRQMQREGFGPQDVPSRAAADTRFGPAQAANNALMNLFELPVLFYTLSLIVLMLGAADILYQAGAWLYVCLRAVQAAIHVSYNNVLQRGLAYLAGSFVLWAMWLRLAASLFLGWT